MAPGSALFYQNDEEDTPIESDEDKLSNKVATVRENYNEDRNMMGK